MAGERAAHGGRAASPLLPRRHVEVADANVVGAHLWQAQRRPAEAAGAGKELSGAVGGSEGCGKARRARLTALTWSVRGAHGWTWQGPHEQRPVARVLEPYVLEHEAAAVVGVRLGGRPARARAHDRAAAPVVADGRRCVGESA
eukprot:3704731-Prymnesium_polylepis.2